MNVTKGFILNANISSEGGLTLVTNRPSGCPHASVVIAGSYGP